jgi:8-oxo-dGTP pyrophosphatase MutT (NUDIX family)
MKIFFGEKTILLSDRPPASSTKNDTILAFHSKKQLKKALQKFLGNKGGGNLFIYSEPSSLTTPGIATSQDPSSPVITDKKFLSSFISLFKILEAAGGIVKNEDGACLFIFRRGKWDLPKGKIGVQPVKSEPVPAFEEYKEQVMEKESDDRAAIREVMEETGLHNVRIIRELAPTYHIYRQKRKWILKPTIWFEMYASKDQELIPEEKEDISDVRWFAPGEMKVVKENTYALIRELPVSYDSSNLSA